ncbi:MAG: hypothetical protein JWP71_1460 [Mucilaginibacter sp.]|nr:hypothetical protein [Mucilaginibacter sp.]
MAIVFNQLEDSKLKVFIGMDALNWTIILIGFYQNRY